MARVKSSQAAAKGGRTLASSSAAGAADGPAAPITNGTPAPVPAPVPVPDSEHDAGHKGCGRRRRHHRHRDHGKNRLQVKSLRRLLHKYRDVDGTCKLYPSLQSGDSKVVISDGGMAIEMSVADVWTLVDAGVVNLELIWMHGKAQAGLGDEWESLLDEELQDGASQWDSELDSDADADADADAGDTPTDLWPYAGADLQELGRKSRAAVRAMCLQLTSMEADTAWDAKLVEAPRRGSHLFVVGVLGATSDQLNAWRECLPSKLVWKAAPVEWTVPFVPVLIDVTGVAAARCRTHVIVQVSSKPMRGMIKYAPQKDGSQKDGSPFDLVVSAVVPTEGSTWVDTFFPVDDVWVADPDQAESPSDFWEYTSIGQQQVTVSTDNASDSDSECTDADDGDDEDDDEDGDENKKGVEGVADTAEAGASDADDDMLDDVSITESYMAERWRDPVLHGKCDNTRAREEQLPWHWGGITFVEYVWRAINDDDNDDGDEGGKAGDTAVLCGLKELAGEVVAVGGDCDELDSDVSAAPQAAAGDSARRKAHVLEEESDSQGAAAGDSEEPALNVQEAKRRRSKL